MPCNASCGWRPAAPCRVPVSVSVSRRRWRRCMAAISRSATRNPGLRATLALPARGSPATGLRLKRRMCHRRWHDLLRDGDADRLVWPRGSSTGRISSSPSEAERRLADWLADLEPEQAAAIARSRGTIPARQDHPARHRRGLALSVRPDARRCRARCSGCSACDPDRHLAQLIERTCGEVCGCRRRAEVMQSAAPDEVGSGAADRAVRYRWRLAGDAGDGSADRSCGRLGAIGAALSAARGSRARKIVAAQSRIARGKQRPDRAGDGQDGRRRTELFQRYRSDRVLRFQRADAGRRTSSRSRFSCASRRALSRLLQQRTGDGYVFRVDLRLRPDPASTRLRSRPKPRCIITSGKAAPGNAPR